MNISIVGTGYVGLVTGICLAAKGHDVVCVDNVAEKVASINDGKSPIHERGLDELLQNVLNKRFRATTDLRKAILDSSVTFIAVGTPYAGDKMDSSYLKAAADEIGASLQESKQYHVVVVKSTVVPGTTKSIVQPALTSASGKSVGNDFGLAMNPEFLREGNAVDDFMDPDRIIIGANDSRVVSVLTELYDVFPSANIITTSIETAEMIKYASNSLLATLISFSNEIGNLSSAIGDIDVVDVMKGVHADRRISPRLPDGTTITPGITTYIEAGCGFGGSCFPKDVKALIAHGKALGEPMRLLSSVIAINEDQPARIIDILGRHFQTLEGARVAILGLAFKPETDDMRESPAIPVVRHLQRMGANIKTYDPIATTEAIKLFGHNNIEYCDSLTTAVAETDAIVLMTRWKEFMRLPELIDGRSPAPLVVDGRRMLSKHSVARYDGIGL